jgi:hypothetical protein
MGVAAEELDDFANFIDQQMMLDVQPGYVESESMSRPAKQMRNDLNVDATRMSSGSTRGRRSGSK